MARNQIFSSNFTLFFKSKSFENDYLFKKFSLKTKYSIIVKLILFLVSLGSTVFVSLNLFNFNNLNKTYLLYLIVLYVAQFLVILLMIVDKFCSQNKKWLVIFNILANLIISVFLNSVRFVIIWKLNSPSVNNIFVIIEFFLKILINILTFTSFVENIISILFKFVLIWLIYAHFIITEMKEKWYLNNLLYVLGLLLYLMLSYIIDKEMKLSFYFKNESEKSFYRVKNILENMNSGFIIANNKKIKYINPFFKKFLDYFFLKDQLSSINNSVENISLNNLNEKQLPSECKYILNLVNIHEFLPNNFTSQLDENQNQSNNILENIFRNFICKVEECNSKYFYNFFNLFQ
jgi:hypothetical protein